MLIEVFPTNIDEIGIYQNGVVSLYSEVQVSWEVEFAYVGFRPPKVRVDFYPWAAVK